MDRRTASLAVAVVAGFCGTALLARARLVGDGAAQPGSLLISAAGAMLGLTTCWAQAFRQQHGGARVVIEKGGAMPAYIAARRGVIDLAAMTRPLTDAEDDASAHHYLVAKGQIGIVVNRASPLVDLGRQQLQALLTGAAANWREVGGPDMPVQVVARGLGTSARQFAEEVLLAGGDFAPGASEYDRAADVVAAVGAHPGGIGAIALRGERLPPAVRLLAIDGVAATRSTALSGRYPFAHGFYLLLYGAADGMRGDFLRYARSTAGQAIVAELGLIPVR